MTEQGVGKLLTSARVYYSNIRLDKPTVNAWFMALCDVPDELALAALVKHARNSVFEVKPADIIRISREMTDTGQTAEEAWTEVRKKLNPYEKPKWSSDLVSETVEVMGYRTLCMSESPEWDRKSFMQIYDTLKKRKSDDKENKTVLSVSSGNGDIKQLGEGA